MNEPVPAIYEQELRLLLALALNGLALFAAYRFARRMSNGDWLDRSVDTLLLFYVIQYLAIGILGIIGFLNIASIAILTLLICAAACAPWKIPKATPSKPDIALANRLFIWGCGVFALGFLGAAIVNQHVLPPLTTDGLTYHLPVAAQWLQTQRLGLYETWFFNPANTYSPLAGSMFMAWLIAPAGNESLARCAQAPALILTFLAAVQIMRGIGVGTTIAMLVATSLSFSRPFVIQALLAKDDLYLAAFLLTALAAMLPSRLADRGGALRVGITVGLFLAMKFTALLALPILFLGADAVWRAGWRIKKHFIAIVVVAVIAGPWYLRNALETGNPIFPVKLPGFAGILSTERSLALRTLEGIWRVVTENYYGLPPVLLIMIALLWLTSLATSVRRMNDPVVRICLLGPLVGFGLFLWKAPYGEVRFLLPSIALMFLPIGLLLQHTPRTEVGVAVAAVLAVISVVTAFREHRHYVLVGIGAIAGIVAIGLIYLDHLRWISRRRLASGTILSFALSLLMLVYAYWNGYVSDMNTDALRAWSQAYPEAAPAWRYVRNDLPDGKTIAYAGTHLTYPLMGFRMQHRVVYAPVRPDVQTIADLPPLDERLPGEKIDRAVAEVTTSNADRDVWMSNLERRGATHVVILKSEKIDTPEVEFVKTMPQRFRQVFVSENSMVFEIVR